MSPLTPARRPWTVDEQKKLDDLLEAGKTAAEIATALQRTPPSIYSRLQRLYRKRPKLSAAWSSSGLKVKGK
jgi:IS30 family transposase